MGFIFTALFFLVFIPIMCYYDSSKRKKKNEKISEAVDKYLGDISETFSDITYKLTTSAEQKSIDQAHWDWASFKMDIFICGYEKGKTPEEIILDRLEHPYHGDMKKAVEILNLSKYSIVKTCTILYYSGIILKWDKEHQNSTFINEHWYDMEEGLRVALKELSIPKDEWIAYGSKVLHMHDLVEKRYYDFYIRD